MNVMKIRDNLKDVVSRHPKKTIIDLSVTK